MKIRIDNTKTVSELQHDFSKAFPYLKIEFYSVPYKNKALLPKTKLVKHNYTLGQIRKTDKIGELKLTPNMSVANLEQMLWEQYELSAQVFRKSGSLWIETSLTDSWTLEQQNLEGEQLSLGMDQEPNIDLYDRDQAE